MYPGRAAVSVHANAVTEGIKQVLFIWRTPESFEDDATTTDRRLRCSLML